MCLIHPLMGRRRRFVLAIILVCLLTSADAREIKVKHGANSRTFNHTLATILVEYASAVYMTDLTELFTWTCSRCKDKTKGFDLIELIVDVQNCLQAFVGVAADLDSIIIAFRGTQEHSLQNWVEDLFWKQLDLSYPGMPDAMVHHGFYSAYHNTTIRHGVLNAVKHAKKDYGDINIMVTGHSMGAAMASFCALDLTVNHGANNVQLMTFGQPRVGNAAFASYFGKHLPHTIRVTNGHDIVPHLPPYFSYFPQKTYHHFPREVWLHDVGPDTLVYTEEKICDSSGEDPSCCRSVTGYSIWDHLNYFGVELRADSPGSCRFLLDKDIKRSIIDGRGNFILSKNSVPASVLKLETQISDSISTHSIL